MLPATPPRLVARPPPDSWFPWCSGEIGSQLSEPCPCPPPPHQPGCPSPLYSLVRFSCNLCSASYPGTEQLFQHLIEVHTTDLCTVRCGYCECDVSDDHSASLHQAGRQHAVLIKEYKASKSSVENWLTESCDPQNNSDRCFLKLKPLTEILTDQALKDLERDPPPDLTGQRRKEEVGGKDKNCGQEVSKQDYMSSSLPRIDHRISSASADSGRGGEIKNPCIIFLSGEKNELATLNKKNVSEVFGPNIRMFPSSNSVLVCLESRKEADKFDRKSVIINNCEFGVSKKNCVSLLKLIGIPGTVNDGDIKTFFKANGSHDKVEFLCSYGGSAIVAFRAKSDCQRWEGKQLLIGSSTIVAQKLWSSAKESAGKYQVRIIGVKKDVSKKDMMEAVRQAGTHLTSVELTGQGGEAIITFQNKENANLWVGKTIQIKSSILKFEHMLIEETVSLPLGKRNNLLQTSLNARTSLLDSRTRSLNFRSGTQLRFRSRSRSRSRSFRSERRTVRSRTRSRSRSRPRAYKRKNTVSNSRSRSRSSSERNKRGRKQERRSMRRSSRSKSRQRRSRSRLRS